MKLVVKFFFLFFFSINLSIASDKVVYIDIDYILSNSNKGKIIINNLEKKNRKNISKLKEKEDILKSKEKDIENKKNILSQEELSNLIDQLKNLIINFRKEKDELSKEFNSYKVDQISKLMKEINPIITNYVKENSIQIVLDKKNILIGKNEYDITEIILDKVNKEIK